MRPDEQGADEYVLTPEQEDRAVALAVARELLIVKAGKFAERQLDPAHLIDVARWILEGDPDVSPLTFEGSPLTLDQARLFVRAVRAYERTQGRVA